MGKYLPKYSIRGKYPRTLILFSTQYKHYEVMGHLDDTFTSTVCNNAEWSKLDNLVAMWIYGTISQPILTNVLNDGWTLHHILKALEDLFRDSTKSRVIQLESEIHSITLGDPTIIIFAPK